MKEYQYWFNSEEIKTIYKFLDALREQGGDISGFDHLYGGSFYLSNNQALFYVEQRLEFLSHRSGEPLDKVIAWTNKDQLDHQCQLIKKNKRRCKALINFGRRFESFDPTKMYCDRCGKK